MMNKISVALAVTIFASTSAFAGSSQVDEKQMQKLKPSVMNQKAAGSNGANKMFKAGAKPGRGLQVQPGNDATDDTVTGSTVKRAIYPPSPWPVLGGCF